MLKGKAAEKRSVAHVYSFASTTLFSDQIPAMNAPSASATTHELITTHRDNSLPEKRMSISRKSNVWATIPPSPSTSSAMISMKE